MLIAPLDMHPESEPRPFLFGDQARRPHLRTRDRQHVRGIRLLLSLLLIPPVVVSCANMPQAGARQPSSATEAPTSPAKTPSPADPRAYYHFMLGYQAEMAQDTEQAIKEYLAALRADPSSIVLKTRLARLYFSKSDLEQAVSFADQVVESDLREASTLAQFAGIYSGAGLAEKALRLYDRALEQQPETQEYYFSKGLLLMTLKRYEEAERVIGRGLDLAKDSALGYYYLGRVGVESDRPKQAISMFERAIATDSSFRPAYLGLASVYEAQQNLEQAALVYRKYLRDVKPESMDMRRHLVRLYISHKRYEQALSELEQILGRAPEDLDAQLRMGLVYGELKQYGKAIEQLTQILGVRPAELRVRDYLGLMYEAVKENDLAIEAYRYNLQLQATYADGHIHLGYLFYRLKRYPEAVTHLAQAVKLKPKRPDGHLILGLTYAQTEQYAFATQAFEEGIVHNPQNADLHYNLGTVYDKLDRFEDVVRAMKTVLQLDPHHADALNYLGYSYAERGVEIEEAVSLTKLAVSLKPNNGYYVDSLGWAFFKMGLLEEALVEIKRAVSLVDDDPVIFEHLGEIYFEQNHFDQAKEAWLHSLELDPSNAKLIERYRELGLGDPTQEARVQQAQRRIGQQSSTPHATP